MPRPAKPYLHRGWWVTNIGGTRQKLCRESEGRSTAEDLFLDLRQQQKRNGGRSFPNLRVVELVALFLDTVKVERSSCTYLDYQRWLTQVAQLVQKYHDFRRRFPQIPRFFGSGKPVLAM